MKIHDTIIIGGGQAGLSVAYFLRRYKLDFLILDAEDSPGGSWLHTWDSLKLFSPHGHSTLSGWRMPIGPHPYPDKSEVIEYLTAYEGRYGFPVERPVRVRAVRKQDDFFAIETDRGLYHSRTVVSATGGAHHPFIPSYGQEAFLGQQLHSAAYRRPDGFVGKRVLVVGGGNSGAQILAEVSRVAHTQWVTLEPPRFLPDEVDGRFLFDEATRKFMNPKAGPAQRPYSLGDIVMLETVKEARSRGVLHARRPFQSFYPEGVRWEEGTEEAFDAVIWCTGFKTDLSHLDPLGLADKGRIATRQTRSVAEPQLWLVGYGNWTGFASATLYGVGKTARDTAKEIDQFIQGLG
ncbi:MAG: ArsO family NAD(P)H-dependent flavin-containing monooxygenase [Bacteroidota bacterium]